MADIRSGIQFVRDRGNRVEQARLNILLHDNTLQREAVDDIRASQRRDGSWAPFWAPDASSLDATCYRLAQCEQLGLKDADFIHHAISFIISRQNQDGSFEEASELASVAPPWVRPGDDSARLYLTSNAGYWIRYYRSSDPCLTHIKDFLMSHVNEIGYLPTSLHANWLAAGFLYSIGEYKSAESIMTYLHSKLPEMEASNFAWLINALYVMGVSATSPLIDDARHKLQHLQREDGRWAGEDGEWQDVHTTLESIRAILSFVGLV